MKQIYSDQYDLNLGNHIFPSLKYRLLKERLLREGIIHPEDIVEPKAASDDDVGLVHHHDYVSRLKLGKLSGIEIKRMEIPYSAQLVRAVWLSAGGSILAGKLALKEKIAANLCGGFHHAYPGHGEGFCVLHDVAIGIRSLQKNCAIGRALIIDCDVHQGNGTAAIFASDPTVFTLSLHQENNYPYPKPPSSLDVNFPDGVGDDEYLETLERSLTQAFQQFEPDLLFYLAGADPYKEDQLGGLALTVEGLRARDEMVIGQAHKHNCPAAITLAGGYAHHVEDTVLIHSNTILAAKKIFEK